MSLRGKIVSKNIAATFLAIGFLAPFSLLVQSLGLVPGYRTSTLLIVLLAIIVIARNQLISIQSISFVIIFLPALAPYYAWDVLNVGYFSLAAKNLQHNIELVDKTTWVFAVAAMAFAASTLIPTPQVLTKPQRLFFVLKNHWLWLIGAGVLISAYTIDPGPTILSSGYTSILEARFDPTPEKMFLTSIFGALWVALFLFGRHRKKLFWFVTIIALTWLILHARRVEVMGISIVLFLWFSGSVKVRTLVFLAVLLLSMQVAIGNFRSVGLEEYLTGNFASSSKIAAKYDKGSLPGGASNVFLSGLHLVNVKDSGMLTGSATWTMLDWPRVLIPNGVWKLLGLPPVRTEHEVVFQDLGLIYVGGMPLVTAFYLNGGLFFAVLFGAVHGAISRWIDKIIRSEFFDNKHRGGSIVSFFVLTFLVYIFRYYWYNPQTPIRALEYSFIVFLLIRIAFRTNSNHCANSATFNRPTPPTIL